MKVYKSLKFWMEVVTVILCLFLGFLVYDLITLDVLPSNLLWPVVILLVLVAVVLLAFLAAFQHKRKTSIVLFILACVVTVVYGTGSFYLFKTYSTLDIVTAIRTENNNVVSVIVLSDSGIDDYSDLDGKTLGVLKSIDTEGSKAVLADLEEKFGVDSEEDIPYETVLIDSVPAEAMQLYDGDVDAIILNEAYRTNVTDLDDYADFNTKTKVIFQTSFYTEEENEALAVSDVTTTSYNILISGNDTYGDVGELSRSDVNMIVTVNPLTSTVLLTSIPRDSYVEVYCPENNYSCTAGQYDKITHTGLYGISSTKETIEELLDIEINYTFRVNFSSVTEIVNALGGIDLDVPAEAVTDTFYADSTLEGVVEGVNHLDGDRALAFARERYAYVDGDYQRVKNQQMVLEAIFDKATSPEIIVNYVGLLNAFQNAFETNLTRDEITDFIKYQIQAMPDWKFETYSLTGYSDMLYSPSLGQSASMTVLNQSSVITAHDKILAVLNGESADSVEESVTDESDYTAEDSYFQEWNMGTAEDYSQYNTYYDPESGYTYYYYGQEEYDPSWFGLDEDPLEESSE